MKNKRLPIFLESMRNSFLIISLILILYTVVQLATFGIFTYEYERELLKDRYREITRLSENINYEISQKGFYEYLQESNKYESDEYIRIYSKNEKYYETQSEVWKDIKLKYTSEDMEIKFKFFDFNMHIIGTAPLTIEGDKYTVQIIRENEMFDELIENFIPIVVFTFSVGLILSGIGAMYVSKIFINRLRKLTKTMNEIKEKGIDRRAKVSELNDEVDKVNIVFNSMMDELEEAFNDQSRFVSDASHELKTPLTALQGHLSMIKRWGKNDKERLEKSIDICLNEVERLKKIVNDMLVLSKAEKVERDMTSIDEINPKTIVDEVIDQYKILNPHVKYTTYIEDNVKIKIDSDDLKQLLIIFIDNSIKYNNKDSIEIQIKIEKSDNKVKLEIRDNGIGIPKDELNNVVKRFYKVDKSRVNNNSFGIGLSIANRLVNNYNGKIEIKSEINKHTTVCVFI